MQEARPLAVVVSATFQSPAVCGVHCGEGPAQCRIVVYYAAVHTQLEHLVEGHFPISLHYPGDRREGMEVVQYWWGMTAAEVQETYSTAEQTARHGNLSVVAAVAALRCSRSWGRLLSVVAPESWRLSNVCLHFHGPLFQSKQKSKKWNKSQMVGCPHQQWP